MAGSSKRGTWQVVRNESKKTRKSQLEATRLREKGTDRRTAVKDTYLCTTVRNREAGPGWTPYLKRVRSMYARFKIAASGFHTSL